MPKYEIKAVLFDLDGVLVDAREWHYEALNRALGLFGHTISRAEHEGFYNGLPTYRKLAKLSEERGFPKSLHGLIYDLKQIYTHDQIHMGSRPSFDKQLMLRRLKNAGIKLAVCSNSIRETIDLMLKRAMLHDYFDLLLSNQDVSRNKPDPEIYMLAMERLEVLPAQTLIVEDAPHGVEAAKRSGAHVIVVANAPDVNLYIFKDYLPHLI